MAINFNLASLIKATPTSQVVDEDLINARNTFGIDDDYLLKDYTDYYKDAPLNLDLQPVAKTPNISGIYNPNLLPLNFNNDNDNDNDRGNMFEDRSPDLVDINDDMYRFDDTLGKKKGIMEILGMLPTPFNLARKGIDFFSNYRKEKEIEKQQAIEAAKIIEQMRQERIKNEKIAKEKIAKERQAEADRIRDTYQRQQQQIRDAGEGRGSRQGDSDIGDSQRGGFATDDTAGFFARGGQVRRNYFNGGIVSLKGKI